MFTRETPTLSAKSSENWANFGGFGGLGIRGFKEFRLLLQKAHVYVNPRRLSHFASKSVEGCDLQVGSGKTQKVTEPPIGKTCRR